MDMDMDMNVPIQNSEFQIHKFKPLKNLFFFSHL